MTTTPATNVTDGEDREIVNMSNPEEAAPPIAMSILEAELARLRDSTMEGWRNYNTWATWFHGFQAVFLGWIMANPETTPTPRNMMVLALAAIVLNLFAMYGALRVRSFVAQQTKRAHAVCQAVRQHAAPAGCNIEITPGFPSDLFRLGGAINAAAFSLAVVVWLYVLSSALKPLSEIATVRLAGDPSRFQTVRRVTPRSPRP